MAQQNNSNSFLGTAGDAAKIAKWAGKLLPTAGQAAMTAGNQAASLGIGYAGQIGQGALAGHNVGLLGGINPAVLATLPFAALAGFVAPKIAEGFIGRSPSISFAGPSNAFDAEYYLKQNPDVAAAGYTVENAQDHWNQHGKAEGRLGADPSMGRKWTENTHSIPGAGEGQGHYSTVGIQHTGAKSPTYNYHINVKDFPDGDGQVQNALFGYLDNAFSTIETASGGKINVNQVLDSNKNFATSKGVKSAENINEMVDGVFSELYPSMLLQLFPDAGTSQKTYKSITGHKPAKSVWDTQQGQNQPGNAGTSSMLGGEGTAQNQPGPQDDPNGAMSHPLYAPDYQDVTVDQSALASTLTPAFFQQIAPQGGSVWDGFAVFAQAAQADPNIMSTLSGGDPAQMFLQNYGNSLATPGGQQNTGPQPTGGVPGGGQSYGFPGIPGQGGGYNMATGNSGMSPAAQNAAYQQNSVVDPTLWNQVMDEYFGNVDKLAQGTADHNKAEAEKYTKGVTDATDKHAGLLGNISSQLQSKTGMFKPHVTKSGYGIQSSMNYYDAKMLMNMSNDEMINAISALEKEYGTADKRNPYAGQIASLEGKVAAALQNQNFAEKEKDRQTSERNAATSANASVSAASISAAGAMQRAQLEAQLKRDGMDWQAAQNEADRILRKELEQMRNDGILDAAEFKAALDEPSFADYALGAGRLIGGVGQFFASDTGGKFGSWLWDKGSDLLGGLFGK